MKFSKLTRNQVTKDTTREFTLHSILLDGENPVVFTVSHAGEVNKPYYTALLKSTSTRMRQVASQKINPALVEDLRETQRKLYTQYIIRGWRNVVSDDGQPVEFNQENCRELLDLIPNPFFDELTAFCSSYSNFMVEDFEAVDHMEEISKN